MPVGPSNHPHRRARPNPAVAAIPAAAFLLCGLLLPLDSPAQSPNNVALHIIPREVLFFGAQGGTWTSVRLDAGERVLQRGADTNVAAVLTSQRLIGFSAVLNTVHEVRVPDDETLEAFKVDGNVVTAITRRRAIGFSAVSGRWSEVDRFQIGR
jgi:hypothetical protein